MVPYILTFTALAGIYALRGVVVMLIWNALCPEVIPLPDVAYWQAALFAAFLGEVQNRPTTSVDEWKKWWNGERGK